MSSSPAATYTSESACHRALRCEEILDQVLQEFVLWDVALRRQSLRNVALTCRAFLHLATASLWSEPPGLWPLYRILIDIPEEFLNTSSQWGPFPSRPIRLQQGQVPDSQSEVWGRFLHYGALIRKIHLLSTKDFDEDFAKDLFILLVGRNDGRSFMPLLREFDLRAMHGLEPAHMLILSSLASPTVTALEILTGYRGDQESCTLVQNGLAATVAKAFPNIYSLILKLQGERVEDPLKIITDLVPLRCLRHLTLGRRFAHCGTSYLQALLSTLPELELLDAYFNKSVVGAPSPASRRIVVPQLRRLICRGRWEAVADLPSAIQCPSLEELRIPLRNAHGPVSHVNCDVLCACVRAVADPDFAPCLRKLDIRAPVGRQIISDSTPPPVRRTLAEILHPLSTLEHLEDFSFVMTFEYQVLPLIPHTSDDDMRTVAATLKRVRRIALELKDVAPLESRPTLHSLVHFATLCPQLVSLSLSQVDVDSATPSELSVRCDTLRMLRLVGTTLPKEPGRLAAFLHDLFPHLDVAECAFPDYVGEGAVVQDELRLLQQDASDH